MSLNYLLDGYNIIHRLPVLAPKKLEDARDDLIRFIEIHRPQGSSNNPVTIVFDGQTGMGGPPKSASVKIIFSSGESADDYIKRAVSRSPQKKNTVVVTDDRDIQLSVRAQGAQVKSVDEFLSRKEAAKNSAATEDSKYISKTLEYKITAEFEQIWLTKPPHPKKF